MALWIAEERSLAVQPNQYVKTAWIDVNVAKLGNRDRMSPEAVEKKYRKILQQGDAAAWPPIVGHWDGDRFVVCDGRHEYLASLMLGREKLFVAWLETERNESVDRS